jgi:hypothetical protein
MALPHSAERADRTSVRIDPHGSTPRHHSDTDDVTPAADGLPALILCLAQHLNPRKVTTLQKAK